MAIDRENIDAVRALLDAGADPNEESKCPGNSTPLFLAVGWGEKGIVQLLLERGANPCKVIHTAENWRRTPLRLAESGGFFREESEVFKDIAEILRKYIKKGRKRRLQIITLHPGKRSRDETMA